MHKANALSAASLIFALFLGTGAHAGTHATSTDSNTPLPVIVGVPNAQVNVMFISSNPSAGSVDFISVNTGSVFAPVAGQTLFCSGAVASKCGSPTAPGTVLTLGNTGVNGEFPIGQPLVFNPPDSSQLAPVQFMLTNNTSGVTFGEEGSIPENNNTDFGSGSMYIDYVSPIEDNGVLTQDWSFSGLPAADAAILSALGPSNLLQYIGWMDFNPTDNADPSDPNSFDFNAAFTYDNMVMAVWFTPSSAPEPGSWALYISGFLALMVAFRRRAATNA
jgi:hypothetical protein